MFFETLRIPELPTSNDLNDTHVLDTQDKRISFLPRFEVYGYNAKTLINI